MVKILKCLILWVELSTRIDFISCQHFCIVSEDNILVLIIQSLSKEEFSEILVRCPSSGITVPRHEAPNLQVACFGKLLFLPIALVLSFVNGDYNGICIIKKNKTCEDLVKEHRRKMLGTKSTINVNYYWQPIIQNIASTLFSKQWFSTSSAQESSENFFNSSTWPYLQRF